MGPFPNGKILKFFPSLNRKFPIRKLMLINFQFFIYFDVELKHNIMRFYKYRLFKTPVQEKHLINLWQSFPNFVLNVEKIPKSKGPRAPSQQC